MDASVSFCFAVEYEITFFAICNIKPFEWFLFIWQVQGWMVDALWWGGESAFLFKLIIRHYLCFFLFEFLNEAVQMGKKRIFNLNGLDFASLSEIFLLRIRIKIFGIKRIISYIVFEIHRNEMGNIVLKKFSPLTKTANYYFFKNNKSFNTDQQSSSPLLASERHSHRQITWNYSTRSV